MAGSVTFTQKSPRQKEFTRLREQVPVLLPVPNKPFPTESRLRVASFAHHGSDFVLVRDLAALWNFPSSYQVITRLTRRSGMPKLVLLCVSDGPLNAMLAKHGLIQAREQNTTFFYIDVRTLHLILEDEASLFDIPRAATLVPVSETPPAPPLDDESITLSQVFPNHGAVETSLPLTHATFLSLTPVTKLQVYKHEGHYRKVYGTALSAHEREILALANNFTLPEAASESPESLGGVAELQKKLRKPLGRLKKFVGNVDPNQLDVTENILPGCGYIPEFNVNALCKVPNYFVANKEMSAQQGAQYQPARAHLVGLSNKGKKPLDMPKQLYQLLSNTDQEAYHFKYYYFKSYRGPGSGNYKDAALVNRINKIRRFSPELSPVSNSSTHIPAGRVTKPHKRRGDLAIKGLTHEYFSNENVEIVVERQRRFVEDFENLEMLHNNTLFNLLINGYRDVAKDTWDAFYKFKMIDFEKMYVRKQRDALKNKQITSQTASGAPTAIHSLTKNDLTNRFLLPSDYPEIMEKLPCELRGDNEDPAFALSEPVRSVARYPDKHIPGMLNQVEVIKLPNANSIGWDNIRKFRKA